jgi:leader peptidase (prepilin peptidase)/N-methyltransferase
VAGLVLIAVLDPSSLPERVGAAALAGGAFLTVALIKPGGMGIGDVKLVALLGLFLGWAVAPAIFVALIAGTVAGVAIASRAGVERARRTTIPFGPFLAAGGVAGLLIGTQLLDWYSATFV